MSSRKDTRIYVGNLPEHTREKDIDNLFYRFGKISNIDLKIHRGRQFAFVQFEDPRDAEDAVRTRNGFTYDDHRLRVEYQRDPFCVDFRGNEGFVRRRRAPIHRSKYRVVISGLPQSGSWQDLKDHMREAGTVCYANTFKDGTGVVEFQNYEGMKHALSKLNNSQFKSHEGDKSTITLKEDNGPLSRYRSQSRSSSRSHSRSRTPRRRFQRTRSSERRTRSSSRSLFRSQYRRIHSRERSSSRSLSRRRSRRTHSRERSSSRSLSGRRSRRTHSLERSRSSRSSSRRRNRRTYSRERSRSSRSSSRRGYRRTHSPERKSRSRSSTLAYLRYR